MDSGSDAQGELKRKRTFRQQTPRKQAKSDDGGGLKSGFGAKMLAKMGYKGTGGLGKDGSGIENPIEVVQRGAKAGVGAVKEKSAQQVAEEKRKAEMNGEKYEGYSDDERKERKKRTKQVSARVTGTPRARPKKTIYDLEAEGVEIPPTLHAILDATTGESTSTSAVRLRTADVSFENPLQTRLKRDIAAFGEAFDQLKSEIDAIPPQEYALRKELNDLEEQIEEVRDVSTRLERMRSMTQLEDVCEAMKELQATYPSRSFSREAVAIIHPLLTKAISGWSPLDDALAEVAQSLAQLASKPASNSFIFVESPTGEMEPTKRGSSTPYESMMLKVWLPHINSTITQWDVTDPYPLVHMMEQWNGALPAFIANRVIRQITQKLSHAIDQWNPRKSNKNLYTDIAAWLPYLKSADLDPKGNGLLAEIKRKLRLALQTISLSRGPPDGFEKWKTVLGSEFDRLVVAQLVPRLSSHLNDNFEIDPSDQDLTALNEILAWAPLMKSEVMGEILNASWSFKFISMLHTWLALPEAKFDEIAQWFSWWKEVLGELNQVPSIAETFGKAVELIHTALELGERAATELPMPEAPEPSRTTPETPQFAKSINSEPPRSARGEKEQSFRDVVEDWASGENLLFIPIRAADESTGNLLYRITASVSGKGGAVVYFKGDMVYVQNKKDKSSWEVIGLDENLVQRAEGK